MILASALMLLAIAAPQAGQFVRLFPNPTGRNGYEEYVRAADEFRRLNLSLDIARLTEVRSREGWTRPTAASLAVRRRFAIKSAGVVRIALRGNSKPFYPIGTESGAATFPRIRPLRDLSLLLREASDVHFSDGRSGEGVRLLLGSLTVARRLGGEATVSFLLMGQEVSATVRRLEAHLPRLSISELSAVVAYATAALREPDPYRRSLAREKLVGSAEFEESVLEFTSGSINDALQSGGEPYFREVHLSALSMMPEQRREARDRARVLRNQYYASVLHELRIRPEATWSEIPEQGWPERVPKTTAELAEVLARMHAPRGLSFCGAIAVIHRTQLRLLRLHAEIVRYEKRTGKSIASLTALNLPWLIKDPLTNRPFLHARQGRRHALASQGARSTGKIKIGVFRPPQQLLEGRTAP